MSLLPTKKPTKNLLNLFSKVTAAEVRDEAVDEMERLREAAEKKEDADAEKLKQANGDRVTGCGTVAASSMFRTSPEHVLVLTKRR